jgi:mannose-6-phosphate isomerase-like protein (cupin superfamily)
MFVPSIAHLQAQTQHVPGGTATYLSHDDLMAIEQKSADQPMNDSQVAVVDINNNEYHLGVGISHRSKASVKGSGAVEHSDVAEVYYIVSGNAILNTGGTIKDLKGPRPGAPSGPSGPTSMGGEIVGGVSKPVGPGDVIIIPPNTPHRFSDIKSDEIVYVLVRPDPHKVLPLMNLSTK